MLLKLSSSVCSLCEDTDVSISEADTEHYIRFIQNELGSDLNWVNSKSFRVCLLCTHSLHLLVELLTGIEDRNVKSCFCCKSSSNIFKQSDLPKDHKANVASFASAFNLRGLKICINCFYAINFWVKLMSFLKSSKQTNTPKSSPKTVSGEKNYSPRSSKCTDNGIQFKLPQNVDKLPEIKRQVKTIRMLQNKMNKVTLRKISSDKKLAEQVPFVFLTKLSEANGSAELIEISDENVTEESSKPYKFRSKRKARVNKSAVNTKKKSDALQNLTSYSTDSDDGINSARNFRNRRAKVKITPLKNKNSPNKGSNTVESGRVETRFSKKNKSPVKNTAISSKSTQINSSSGESDNNDYSVASSGSNTSIVIKRISRTNSQKLASSPLRTIRIQTRKANTSSSSDNTDVFPSTSTPRSPATLPPKKNRKRIMAMSDTEYYETALAVAGNKQKRTTRANNKKKQTDKDIEEVIVESSEDAALEKDKTPNYKRIKSGGKVLRSSTRKEPLDIISSREGSDTDPESTKRNKSVISSGESSVAHSEDSSPKEKSPKKQPKRKLNSAKLNSSKRVLKRLLYTEDDSDNSILNEAQEEACNTIVEKSPSRDEDCGLNDSSNNETENDTSAIDQIVSKYMDDDIAVEAQTDIMPADDTNSIECESEVLDTMRAIHGTEEVNSVSSIISPSASNDTLELLASISEDAAKDGNAGEDDSVVGNQLNLQLTPEAQINSSEAAAKDSESTVLMTNDSEEDDIFGDRAASETKVRENVEDAITKASSQSSVYQDAVDSEESTNKCVTVLEDICISSQGECTGEEVKDIIEETLMSMKLNVSKDSLVTEDDSNDDKEGLAKRKRNADDSVESADAPPRENDETPRTKRVRFAAEKKILNEDDSVCLEDCEGSEEQKEAFSPEDREQIETGNAAEVADTEELCSLDM